MGENQKQNVNFDGLRRRAGTSIRSARLEKGASSLSEEDVPLHDAEGVVIGLCGISCDFSERLGSDLEPGASAERVRSKVMEHALRLAKRAAKHDTVILVLGESGSGKDHLARYIHDHSRRSSGPYFSVNCAALPLELAESELFGHENGAFTGAHARKRGLLELAEGGTLLLNEIGDLSLLLQAKLLTFLDTKKFTRVGGEREISVNARLMFATNKDLETEIEEGRFRKDLFYRINVMTITVPPLRDRIEDIQALARVIMSQIANEIQLSHIPPLDAASCAALTRYNWPGNVRELRNVLERSLILSEGKTLNLFLSDLTTAAQDWSVTSILPSAVGNLQDTLDRVTKSFCMAAIRQAQGNRAEAARILGISRDSLYRYLKRFGLVSQNRKRPGKANEDGSPEAHRCQSESVPSKCALIRKLPQPRRKIVGDLSDTQKALAGLDL
jgi:two-component system response regulator AtoC